MSSLSQDQFSTFVQAAEHGADDPVNQLQNPQRWPMSDEPADDLGQQNVRGRTDRPVGNDPVPRVVNVSAEDIGPLLTPRDPLRSHGAAHRITRKLVFQGSPYTDGSTWEESLTDYVRNPEGPRFAAHDTRGRYPWRPYVGLDAVPDERGVSISFPAVGDMGLPDESGVTVRLPGGKGGNREVYDS